MHAVVTEHCTRQQRDAPALVSLFQAVINHATGCAMTTLISTVQARPAFLFKEKIVLLVAVKLQYSF